jgi:hypothetical protein
MITTETQPATRLTAETPENGPPTPENMGRETRGRAIRRFCIQCMGGGQGGDPMRGPTGVIACIRDCPSTACALYPFRPYRETR